MRLPELRTQALAQCPADAGARFAHLPQVFSDYIAISRFQVDVVGERLPAGSRLHLVSNPIDVPDLGPKPSPAQGDIIFVGRISAEKGPLLFAEAARRAGIVPVYIVDGPAAAELQAKLSRGAAARVTIRRRRARGDPRRPRAGLSLALVRRPAADGARSQGAARRSSSPTAAPDGRRLRMRRPVCGSRVPTSAISAARSSASATTRW
jgi:hypothetical protein